MGKVGEGGVTERIIANVLNDAAAISIGASFIELLRREAGIAAEEQRNDGIFPGEIDELLMGKERVGKDGAADRWE